MSVPIYLFCGFLDGGKTTFIQETLEDPEFNTGEKTLLLLCEEGEIEYEPKKFAGGNVTIATLDDPELLTPEFFSNYKKHHRVDRALIEYNGMWELPRLYSALPDDWELFQVMTVADSTTFQSYMTNMRQLAVDKLQDPEVVLFNRCDDSTDRGFLHRCVRMTNRRAQILFECRDGSIIPDDTIDPPPYDVNAPVIEVKDEDFGAFYMDAFDRPEVYKGKTVRFLAYVCQSKQAPKGCFVAGRFVMTCCANDITYVGMLCEAENAARWPHRSWATVEAKIEYRRHAIYEGMGPWLVAKSVTAAKAPADELVYLTPQPQQ